MGSKIYFRFSEISRRILSNNMGHERWAVLDPVADTARISFGKSSTFLRLRKVDVLIKNSPYRITCPGVNILNRLRATAPSLVPVPRPANKFESSHIFRNVPENPPPPTGVQKTYHLSLKRRSALPPHLNPSRPTSAALSLATPPRKKAEKPPQYWKLQRAQRHDSRSYREQPANITTWPRVSTDHVFFWKVPESGPRGMRAGRKGERRWGTAASTPPETERRGNVGKNRDGRAPIEAASRVAVLLQM